MSRKTSSSQSTSLLETFGNPNYRKLTAQSLKNLERRYVQHKDKEKQRTLSRVSMLSVIEEEEEAEARVPDVELLDGRPAPPKFGQFPKKQFGKPIEELDDARSIDRTFCVVGKRFKSTSIYRFSSTRSCYVFSPLNPARTTSILLLTNQFFDIVVMLTILANCIFLALDEPRFPAPGEPDVEPAFLKIAEYVFTGIYSFEMFIKIIARGFILEKFTYLRDPWNWLDFSVILLAYVTFFLTGLRIDVGNFSGLRTFRVLRALKTISVVPGLKSIINALLRSTKMLAEVLLLTVFVLAIFALLALQLFMGVLRQKCVADYDITINNDSEALWFMHVQDEANWFLEHGDPVICSNISALILQDKDGWSGCPTNYTCLDDIGDNPNFGFTSFDNFGWAMITSFQLITLDYWEDVYNQIIRATGPWSMFFFFMTVMFGSFYLINLMLAVVSMAYTEEMENQGKEKALEAERLKKQNVLEMNPAKLRKIAARKKRKLEKQKQRQAAIAAANAELGIDDNADEPGTENAGYSDGEKQIGVPLQSNLLTSKFDDTGDDVSRFSDNAETEVTSIQDDDDDGMEDATENGDDTKTTEGSDNGSVKDKDTDSLEEVEDPDKSGDMSTEPIECCPYKICCTCCRANCVCSRKIYHAFRKLQYFCGYIVLDPLSDLFITLCIVINTCLLAAYYHGIDPNTENGLELGNQICTAVFTVECVLKVTALGFKYFKNPWNSFDFFIVIMSIVEIPLTGVEGLSVLRTFRLMRVLKLAQSWTTMRMLLSIIGSTVGAIGNVSIVLIIIIYIFAIIGMQLFGKDYVAEKFEEGEYPRWNFRDFIHSLLMVFRILCGEWIEPLYDCMRASETGPCIAVIIATFFCGNVMILNLFLALLLNSFASDSLKNKEVEISRLTLAIDKLKRFFWMAVNCCICRRRRCKVATSTESLQEDEKDKVSTTIKPDIVMVVEDDDKISQIINLHDGGKVTTIEMKRVDSIGAGDKHNTLMVRKVSMTGSNGLVVNGHSNPPSRNGSIVSLMDNFDRPKSRAAFIDPAKDSVTTGNGSLTVPHANGSISNGNAQNGHVRNGSNVSNVSNGAISNGVVANGSISNGSVSNGSVSNGSAMKSKNAETGEEETSQTKKNEARNMEGEDGDGDEEEDKVEEDIVKDCFPAVMDSWFRRKCPFMCCKNPDDSAMMKKWHSFRHSMCLFVEHRSFEWFILFIIFASSVTLTFENIYLDKSFPRLKNSLTWLNLAFAVIFLVEMLMKWAGLGFKKYFTSFWCWLDFAIVLIAWLGIIADAIGISGVGAFRALRTLRALRPLRAISRWQGMKIVVNALAHAIPAIINVVMVIGIFWLIFSIIGVQFFGGTFFKCLDANGDKITNLTIVNNRSDCLRLNLTWKNSEINFDNCLHGYIALFQVATFEGWMEVMEDAVDARGVDKQPFRESSLLSYAFFVIFIVVGSFFTLNLFIGVIIDNFNALKRKYEGDSSFDMFLTNNQKNYYQTMRRLGTKKPTKQIKQPKNTIRMWFFNFTNNTKFEVFIVLIIFFNMVTMMIDHYKMDEGIQGVLNYFNYVFTGIFTVECCLKLIGYGIYYFRIPWNLFDFIVVILSLMGIILDDVLSSSFVNPTLLRVLRLFRIGRVLRLVKSAKGIRKLLFALVISLPALLNIGALLTLIIFIFSIVGMSQFGYVRHNEGINDVVNFETWTNSMMLLFRVATSAGWNDVLEPLMVDDAPGCDPTYMGYENGDCGNKYFAIFFFMFFLVITFLVIINMYIAVILENFSQAHAQEEVGITEDDFSMFYQTWEAYDPNATQFIEYEFLSEFCDKLEAPLRLAKPNHIKIAGLDLPIYNDTRLHCLDVLFALTKRVLGDVEETSDFQELQEQMSQSFAESFPDRQSNIPTTTTMQIKKRLTAAKVIQRSYRLYRLKREINRASSIYRRTKGSQENSRASSARSRKPPSLTLDGARLDASFNSTFGATLTLPGQLGLGRTPTPSILEDVAAEESTSGMNSVKADAYRVTVEPTVEVVNENQVKRRLSSASKSRPGSAVAGGDVKL